MGTVIEHPPEADLGTRVARGTAALGLELDSEQVRRLVDYLQLLVRWNGVYNLTAVRDPIQMVATHLLDSLAVAPLVRELHAVRLLDVGSGAGLPGIPLSIALPELAVSLVDAVGKKIAFLNQVKGVLRLDFTPIHARVEALTTASNYDCIVSRAFSSLADFTAASAHLLAPQGTWIALKAQDPGDEIRALPDGIEVVRVVALDVPDLDAQRCAVLMRPRAS